MSVVVLRESGELRRLNTFALGTHQLIQRRCSAPSRPLQAQVGRQQPNRSLHSADQAVSATVSALYAAEVGTSRELNEDRSLARAPGWHAPAAPAPSGRSR